MSETMNELPIDDQQTNAQSYWGPQRHKYIGMQADKRLTDKARKAVAAILETTGLGQSTLGEIATWADEIKGGGPKDPDTLQFLNDFPKNDNWHYVNLPLDVSSYDQYPEFTRDNDVVQMIAKSIRVLQGDLDMMSEVNALRWLVHLVGDVHQPVHVGCSYIDFKAKNAELITDPEVIISKGLTGNPDRGGGLLLLPLGSGVKLHSYWDSNIPSLPPSEADLANIQFNIPTGAPETWAEEWAYDSVKKSRIAYQSLRIEGEKNSKNEYKVSWMGKEAYDKLCAPIVTEQLALGSERLALLVNQIFQ